jgi:hypothetical protein
MKKMAFPVSPSLPVLEYIVLSASQFRLLTLVVSILNNTTETQPDIIHSSMGWLDVRKTFLPPFFIEPQSYSFTLRLCVQGQDETEPCQQ